MSEFTALTQSIQSMNSKLDSLTPSLLPVRTLATQPPPPPNAIPHSASTVKVEPPLTQTTQPSWSAKTLSGPPLNGGLLRGPLISNSVSSDGGDVPLSPPRIPERTTQARPTAANRAIEGARTIDKTQDVTKKTGPVVVLGSSHFSSATLSVATTESSAVTVNDREEGKQLAETQLAEVAASSPVTLVSWQESTTETTKEEVVVVGGTADGLNASRQEQVGLVQREKIQKTKSQELRDFTQEFIATSTIDFDPMSFQDHQSPRNTNDTLQRRLMAGKKTTVATKAVLSVMTTAAQLPPDPAVSCSTGDEQKSQTISRAVAVVPGSSTAVVSPEDAVSAAVPREKIVPSASFMKNLKLSSSESSQEEPPPTKPTPRTSGDATTATHNQLSKLPVRQQTPLSPTVDLVGSRQQNEQMIVIRSKEGPMREDEEIFGSQSKTVQPVRQDLHSAAGAGTSSDLLEWAKTILASYPGLKVTFSLMINTYLVTLYSMLPLCEPFF